MELLVCEGCGARHFSAAAETLVACGARCERCSALLGLDEPAEAEQPLAAVVGLETKSGRLRRPD